MKQLQICQKGLFGVIAIGFSYGIYRIFRGLTKGEFRENIKQQIVKCYNESINKGFVEPFDILQTFSKNEQGIEFHIKLVKSLAKKPVGYQQNINPLIEPFEEGQLVLKLQKYNLLLNKYPVNPYHTLLVPEQFIHQTEKFSKEYLSLTYDVLCAVEGFAFFNSHSEAGASLDHKHVQIVSKLAYQSANILNHIREWQFERSLKELNKFIRLRYLKKIKHFILFFNQDQLQSKNCDELQQQNLIYETYERLLNKCQVDNIQDLKHNLIMTQEFMMIVVRKKANYNGVSFNAVCFTGSLLAKNEQECEKLKQARIIEILEYLAEVDEYVYQDIDEC
ncbi:unnamed protein product [Paramecium primaurelia]|uniref:ATP adenylyltransferase n=1 Tax=Paramecium primaurelia TaxID=5886 RepID=A0A8S1NUA1_PARPR|nr:unnamed protein product [Paramecium primaurelia]